jgi:hypothetical protein
MIPDLDDEELAMLPPIPGTFKMPVLQPGLSKQASFGMPLMTRLPSIGVRTISQRETQEEEKKRFDDQQGYRSIDRITEYQVAYNPETQ